MTAALTFALALSLQDRSFPELLPQEAELAITIRNPAGLLARWREQNRDAGIGDRLREGLNLPADFDLEEAFQHVAGEFSFAAPTFELPGQGGEDAAPARPQGVIYIRPGEKRDEFARFVEEKIAEAEDQGQEIGEETFRGVEVRVIGDEVYTFWLEDAFVVAFSEDYARDVIRRATGAADEGSLATSEGFRAARQALGEEPADIQVYAATAGAWTRMIEGMAEQTDPSQAPGIAEAMQRLWESTGITGVQGWGGAIRFGTVRTELRSFAYVPRGPEGIVRAMFPTGVDVAWPSFRTDDWDMVYSFQMDAAGAFDAFSQAFAAAMEAAGMPMNPDEMFEMMGVDFRGEVLENLTGNFTVFAREDRDADPPKTVVATAAAVRNPQQVADAMSLLLESVSAMGDPNAYRSEDYLGSKLHLVFGMAIAVHGDYFIVGGEDSVRQVVQRVGQEGRSVRDRDEFASLSDDLPSRYTGAFYFTPAGFRWFWNGLRDGSLRRSFGGNLGDLGNMVPDVQEGMEEGPGGMRLDFLPRAEDLAPNLIGVIAYNQRREDGVFTRVVLQTAEYH